MLRAHALVALVALAPGAEAWALGSARPTHVLARAHLQGLRARAAMVAADTDPTAAVVRAGRRSGPPPELTIPGDTLETLPAHVAYTLAFSAAVLVLVARAALLAPLPTAAAVLAALYLGDLMSSLIHWATDNYGDINTPLVGSVCAAFQGHHKAPWTITYRSFFNNVHKIAKTALPAVGLAAVGLQPLGAAFAASLLYSQLLAQELHRWSHCLPDQLSPWQLAVQDSGLVLSRRSHLQHHSQPFDAHYAILLGVANPLPLFRWLEARVYAATGIEANCWREEKGGDDVRARALTLAGMNAR